MDPISVSAGIAALLQLSSVVISYLSDVKGGPRELQRIRLEVCSVLPMLSILQDQAEEANIVGSWSLTLLSLDVRDGPIHQFKTALERLQSKLAAVTGIEKLGKAFTWPFKSKEIEDILNTIERQRSLFILARQNDHIALSKAIKGDTTTICDKVDEIGNEIENMRINWEHEKIRRWLSAPDPSSNHKKALKGRHIKTGTWFLGGCNYLKWLSKSGSFLCIYGIPGCGKTILSSTIIQRTMEYCHARIDAVVLYFYFHYNDVEKQGHEAMIRSLLEQLLIHSDSIPASLASLHSSCREGRHQSTPESPSETLRLALRAFKEVFIIIDALDECTERAELLADINRICGWKDTDIQILAISWLEKDLGDLISSMTIETDWIRIYYALVDADIRQYVHDRLQTDPRLKRWQRQQEEIEVSLMEKTHGVFRWATYQLDALGSCRSPAQLRKALATLPRTLDKTYERMLCRIRDEDRRYALKILRWLTYSARPLRLKEIVDFIAIDHEETPRFDPERRFMKPFDVLDICASLVTTVYEPSVLAITSPIVQLAHFSVKEYLISDTIRNGPAADFAIQEGEANETIAKDCLIYLLQFDGPSHLTPAIFREYPLLRYAASFWAMHLRNAEMSGSAAIALAHELLSVGSEAYHNWARICNTDADDGDLGGTFVRCYHGDGNAPPLYCASVAGLVKSVRSLLESGAACRLELGTL